MRALLAAAGALVISAAEPRPPSGRRLGRRVPAVAIVAEHAPRGRGRHHDRPEYMSTVRDMPIRRSWVRVALAVVTMAVVAFFGEMLLHDASDWLILAVALAAGLVVGGLVRLG